MPIKYDKVVIGIDQSYTRTGISIAADGKLLKVKSISFKGCQNKSDKRKVIRNSLYSIFSKVKPVTSELIVLCEKIRTFDKVEGPVAKGKPQFTLSTNYIKATGALIATIVDTAYEHNIPVYSVDTRSWKAQVVGTTKGGKQPTIDFVKKLGFDVSYETSRGTKKYDDDASDSAGIALYGFIAPDRQKLTPES